MFLGELSQSCVLVTSLMILASSSTIFRYNSSLSGNSFSQIRKNSGPKIDPWGTPLVTFSQFEKEPLTCVFLSVKVILNPQETSQLCLPRYLVSLPASSGDGVKYLLAVQKHSVNPSISDRGQNIKNTGRLSSESVLFLSFCKHIIILLLSDFPSRNLQCLSLTLVCSLTYFLYYFCYE